MIRIRIQHLLLSGLLILPLCPAFGQGFNAPPDQLKALFLFNFTQFVEWPVDAFTHRGAPFVIGLYAPAVFGRQLDEAVYNGRACGRPIRVLPVNSITDIAHCQMLFINRNQIQEFYVLQPRLRGLNILTVSDAPEFCKSGGMIGFIQEKSKIRFQINPEAAAGAGLKISSKLLKLAEIVFPKS